MRELECNRALLRISGADVSIHAMHSNYKEDSFNIHHDINYKRLLTVLN